MKEIMINKITFCRSNLDEFGNLQVQLSDILGYYLASGKDFEINFSEIKKSKSSKSLNGFWRLCSLLAPHISQSYGELFDKELVSDLVKLSAGYSIKTKTGELPKSLKIITQEKMNVLIEKLYFMCEWYELKDYELVPYELQEINNYFKE